MPPRLTHWRPWIDLATLAFAVGFLLLLSGDAAVWVTRATIRTLGQWVPIGASDATVRALYGHVVKVSLGASVLLFFVGFGLFHRRQERAG